MTCPDIKQLLYGELPESEQQLLRQHARECESCGIELARLEIADAALRSLPAEEIPVHIRFVSDKVFEPRWWQRLGSLQLRQIWAPAMLGLSLLFFGASTKGVWNRPAVSPATRPPAVSAQLTEKQIDERIQRVVNARLKVAVQDMEARQTAETKQMLAAFRRQAATDRQGLVISLDNAYRSVDQKLNNIVYAANEKLPVVSQ